MLTGLNRRERLDWGSILALRMERQYLPNKAGAGEYYELFRDFSPVPAEGGCEPGSPPTLSAHVDFDDGAYNFSRRSRREILKGRFTGDGVIGYVTREDLELYACLSRRDPGRLTFLQEKLLELLRQEGPMSIGLMKEFTGLLVKEITPALHKLQKAFLVFEDQPDNGGDRAWFLFEDEFQEVNLGRYTRNEALARIIPRFARRNVFIDEAMLRSFYKLPLKEIHGAMERLLSDGTLVAVEVGEQKGCLLSGDFVKLREGGAAPLEPSAILIQRNDFLVKSNEHWLKERFPAYDKWEPLYYLLLDGDFRGAVIGRFKFGPHIVENICTDLSPEEQERRKPEILAAVALRFNPKESPIHRYNGTALS